jgi:hypothetical protein
MTLRNLARIGSECPGLAGRVAEILDVTADQAQGPLNAHGAKPEASGPEVDAANE